MKFWLAQAAEEARGDVRPEVVAGVAGLSSSSLARFERGQSLPHEIDRLLAAYAREAGIEDPRDIWDQALKLWREHGYAPTLEPDEAGIGPLVESQGDRDAPLYELDRLHGEDSRAQERRGQGRRRAE